jgi:thiol-disulfide isomerase/thioredoxin
MLKPFKLFAAAFCAFALLSSVVMADATLKPGDAAPALSVSKFVKGEPVKGFEKGKIYVVEFWATWCGPCRASIPHLTQMQKANPDVTFIGSNVGEDEAKVMPFVKEMGDKMDYRVAVDKDGQTNAAYMEAAGQNGIPTAFVIDKDSKIAWIGHPMKLEPVLKAVVAGTFDIQKAAAASAAEDKVIALLQQNDFDGAMKAIDEIIAKDPDQIDSQGLLQFEILLKGKKDTAAAAKKADEIAPRLEDGQALNEIAWMLATVDKPSPEVLAAAQKASELSLVKTPDSAECTDTLARVYALKGDFTKATELETKAISNCKDDAMKASLNKSLEAYKTKTLPAAE